MEKKLEKLIKISVFIEFYYENIYLIVTHLKDKSKYNIYLENLKELVTLEKKLLDSFTEEELSYLYNKIIFNYSSIETESTPLLTICAKIKEKYEYLNNDLDDDYDYIQENEIFHTINAIKDVYSKLIDFSNEYDILYDESKLKQAVENKTKDISNTAKDAEFKFEKISDDGENSVWSFVIPKHYEKRNCVIEVN